MVRQEVADGRIVFGDDDCGSSHSDVVPRKLAM
jgi:hypothetical protein